MKTKYFMLATMAVVLVVLVTLNVYADKENEDKNLTLPEAVVAAIQSLYPQAQIEEAKQDQESVMLYEVEVVQDEAESELSIAPDGTVVEEEQEISVQDLPQAIQDAIAGSDVEEVSKEVTYWVVTLKKLDAPRISYEIELKQDGKEKEVEFAADGTVLKQEIGDDDDGDDADDDNNGDDDDDDEEEDEDD